MTVQVGDSVKPRKAHACGSNLWTVVRVGADFKLKCAKCGRVVMLSSEKFYKAVKTIDGK